MIVGEIYEILNASEKAHVVGTFAEVRVGKNVKNGETVAVKMELLTSPGPQLHKEYRFYKQLGSQEGLPDIYYFGRSGKYSVLIMEKLGPSLSNLFDISGRRFSLKTVLLLADQMLTRFQFIHSKGLIYQDVKPENFVFGKPDTPKSKILHFIDFGLSKEFIDPDTKKHVPYSEESGTTGTYRYVSINAQQGKEQSRRDDLESMGHMLMFFLRGNLPWQSVETDGDEKEMKKKFGKIKMATTIEQLCDGHPAELTKFFDYVRNMQFLETPNYDYLRKIFRDVYLRKGYKDDEYDWEGKVNISSEEKPPKSTDGDHNSCITIVGGEVCKV